MSLALDANILLYASDAGNPHHAVARAFLEACIGGDEIIYLAWPTLMAYLRIATHPGVFDQPLTHEEASANVEALLRCPHVRVLTEAEGFWAVYRATTAAVPTRGNLVPDAHLASLLRQHGVRIIHTHDCDFRKFDFLRVADPFATAR